MSLEAKGRQVERILSNSARCGNSHVLVIEEAHDLTNYALKYLKRFWELEDGFNRLLGVVMIGQPELAKKLDERTNYDLRELIRRTEIATLRPLNGDLENYLALKFKRIGVALADVFCADAFDAIRSRLIRRKQNAQDVESHAYPLLVHAIVIKAMNAAAELGLPKVSGELIGRL
jgi:type II secretory pathway predicted ATPase ExeA